MREALLVVDDDALFECARPLPRGYKSRSSVLLHCASNDFIDM
jgi:hypothetical protein